MVTKNAIKYVRSLSVKKFRDAEQSFVAEGPKAVAEDVVELKIRRSGETVTAGKADAVQKALELLAGL